MLHYLWFRAQNWNEKERTPVALNVRLANSVSREKLVSEVHAYFGTGSIAGRFHLRVCGGRIDWHAREKGGGGFSGLNVVRAYLSDLDGSLKLVYALCRVRMGGLRENERCLDGDWSCYPPKRFW